MYEWILEGIKDPNFFLLRRETVIAEWDLIIFFTCFTREDF